MNKSTFCSLPFTSIFLGSDGGVKPCCSLRGDLGNINQQPIEEILNGPIARGLRQDIIDGNWNKMCSQCEELESKGARTERIHTVALMEQFKEVKQDYFRLDKLDLRWSNTCNLTCNYCYEYFSSQWAAIKGIKVNSNKEHAEDSIFSFIEKHKDSITNIQLLGGEPLLQKPNNRLIDIVPDSNYYILTNLSTELKNNVIAKKLLANKKAIWGVSFETIGERFEYVRHGAKWKTLNDNFDLLAEYNRPFDTHPLYCVYSAFNLLEYYDFLKTKNNFNQMYWQLLQNIPGLDVFRLPNPMKKIALMEIEKVLDIHKEEKWNNHLLQNIYNKLKESMDSPRINSLDAFKYPRELEKDLPNKEKEFIRLWPEVYKNISIYNNSKYPL